MDKIEQITVLLSGSLIFQVLSSAAKSTTTLLLSIAPALSLLRLMCAALQRSMSRAKQPETLVCIPTLLSDDQWCRRTMYAIFWLPLHGWLPLKRTLACTPKERRLNVAWSLDKSFLSVSDNSNLSFLCLNCFL